MRPSFASVASVALLLGGTACALALPVADEAAAGFLSATFLGDVPHVFLHYSQADAPVTFTAVSGSKGVLVPTLGTGGARDPYIFQNQVNGNVSGIAVAC